MIIFHADTKRHAQFYSTYIIDNCFLLYVMQSGIPNLHTGVKWSCISQCSFKYCFPKKTIKNSNGNKKRSATVSRESSSEELEFKAKMNKTFNCMLFRQRVTRK